MVQTAKLPLVSGWILLLYEKCVKLQFGRALHNEFCLFSHSEAQLHLVSSVQMSPATEQSLIIPISKYEHMPIQAATETNIWHNVLGSSRTQLPRVIPAPSIDPSNVNICTRSAGVSVLAPWQFPLSYPQLFSTLPSKNDCHSHFLRLLLRPTDCNTALLLRPTD